MLYRNLELNTVSDLCFIYVNRTEGTSFKNSSSTHPLNPHIITLYITNVKPRNFANTEIYTWI